MGKRPSSAVRQLADLVPLMQRQAGMPDVLQALARNASGAVDGAWGSSCALTAAVVACAAPAGLLVVHPRIGELDDFAADLASFLGRPPEILPATETVPRAASQADPAFGPRVRFVRRLLEQTSTASPPGESPVWLASMAALTQPVPSPAALAQATRRLQVGDLLPPEELLAWLSERQFERVSAVALPGEYARHGGIVDLHPFDGHDPYRIEFFGDEIESIRTFDVESQRKLADIRAIEVTAFRTRRDGSAGAPGPPDAVPVTDLLPAGVWIALVELADLPAAGSQYLSRLGHPSGFLPAEQVLAGCTRHPTVSISRMPAESFETSCRLRIESVERFPAGGKQAIEELARTLGRDERALLVCHNAAEMQRIGELLAAAGGTGAEKREERLAAWPLADRVTLCEGRLAQGFRLVHNRLVVLTDHELFGRTEVRRTPRRRGGDSRAIDSFLDLNEGDLVVHLAHGIARYRGMELLRKGEQFEDHLKLEFRDGVMVYVPAALIHLVQKYVGGSKSDPPLSKIGSSSWERKKEQVAGALLDMAGEMIRLQAERAARPGIAFPPDSAWQREFEAAFSYVETPDQLKAVEAIKQDMERPRPMDRLLCGDVGYGKTEVALRAAFKAVDAGKQVAVLVPTTVLAEQHYRSFLGRLAEFPFVVDLLSRFRTRGEQQEILRRLEQGRIDLIVGTHRLVQSDVRFHDLGLVIIDEEQRFGVDAKERLKQLRLEVDVLTLSATPIPRTLHQALLGIRDISNLETPPLDRLPVETRICRWDAELIRAAIVRELNRNGQVYFVHNRVYDIEHVAEKLQRIVPEARIAIVHGQMSEHELEPAMTAFVRGEVDLLVATTIIESGLDIPNANTMFIHEADRYGLADLHQLRGRVGRYKHRAYCYLILEPGRSVTDDAAKRLKAIEEFSELGAGFKIAMRDLEIRGAGNLLGTEQSGHIAAVGYELYCQLLEQASRRLRNEPVRETRHVAVDLPVAAYIPGDYIPPGRAKMEAYRRLARIAALDELDSFGEELRDRYGPLPVEVQRLFQLRELQVRAQPWQIDGIHLEEGLAILRSRDPRKLRRLRDRLGDRLRIEDERSASLRLTGGRPDEILAELREALGGTGVPAVDAAHAAAT